MRRVAAVILASSLAACGSDGPSESQAEKSDVVPKAVAAKAFVAPAVETEHGTPVKDRVATIGLLNKRNNLQQDIVLKSGETKRVGNVIVRLATCERTLPWETPPETGAFVQVYIEERASAGAPLAWRSVFSGWLFKNSPSLNVVEHPVYDVWVKDCAMKFPGEEEVAASPSSAAKASGSGNGGPPRPAASAAARSAPKAEAKAAASESPVEEN